MNTGPTIPAVLPFLEGKQVKSDSTKTIDVVNPSNGQTCCTQPAGTDADVERAVASCRRAADEGRWSEMAPSGRKKVLRRWAELIAHEGDALNALDAEDMGKPIGLEFGNAQSAAGLAEFYAESVDKLT